jgi:hypothetical protein
MLGCCMVLLVGCGSPEQPEAKSRANAAGLAEKIKADKTASPEARVLAGNLLEKIRTDQQATDFQSGK